METQLFISDARMIQLMEYCVATGLAKNRAQWCNSIGYSPMNWSGLIAGRRGFTNAHILAAAKMYDVNLNWLFGLEENMLRTPEDLSPIEAIKAAVAALEAIEASIGKSNKIQEVDRKSKKAAA